MRFVQIGNGPTFNIEAIVTITQLDDRCCLISLHGGLEVEANMSFALLSSHLARVLQGEEIFARIQQDELSALESASRALKRHFVKK